MPSVQERLQRVPGNPWQELQRADRAWAACKQGQVMTATAVGGAGRGTWTDVRATPMPVQETAAVLGAADWDVMVAGGTLGLLVAWGLRRRGYRVAVLERGALQGRRQEWNISRAELQSLLDLELLTPAELATAIVTEYNPGRIQFANSPAWWVTDVLNVGVRPDIFLQVLQQKFLQEGGYIGEFQPVVGLKIGADAIEITTVHQGQQRIYRSRLLLDMMGHFSPLTQLARRGQVPDGVCLVVGGCAQGFPESSHGDLIVTTTPIINDCQYFWEAFPAQDGRTTYLFTYVDTHPQRPSLTELFAAYFAHLPAYQGVDVDALMWQRFVFGFFPSYRRSPLGSHWARILPVGDSSGMQSPLSFGGFGALLRHLPRLLNGIDAALQADALDRHSLSLLQPYQPNLALTWLFQQVMRVPVGANWPPNLVNEVLATAFGVMATAGDAVLKPFLRDVIQLSGLTHTLVGMVRQNPCLVAQVVQRVGVGALLDWTGHYAMLSLYTLLAHAWGEKPLPTTLNYTQARLWEQLHYGSGRDYVLPTIR
ncbi:FAD-binding oxidoreductase [Gloeomargarita sp.]